MDGVASIAAGYAHTCAIGSGRNLHCWGFNRYGQLGDGTKNDKLSPTLIIEGGVAAVAPGDVQTCAILVGATVQCWGNNLLGELGNASRAESLQPAEVCANASCTEVLADIVQLSAGDHHACGVDSAGSVYCWGSNIAGQLGVVANEGCPNAGHPCSTTPVLVPLAGPAASVSAGTASTCAVLVSGGIQCWGRQLDSPNAWDAPTTLEAWDSGISQLAAAKGHACVFTQEGMQCFGANGYGQLGDGTFVDRSATSPRRVWTLSGRGDADCDLNITSLDAALVLQRVAQLLVALPCPSVTAALDNQGSSTDALAILQFGAGLLT